MSPQQDFCVKNGNNLKKVLVISFILNILLLFVFVILLVLRGNFHNNKSQSELGWTLNDHIHEKLETDLVLTEDDICVSCDELGDGVNVKDTLYDFITRSSCGRKLCCFKDRGLQKFISKILNSSNHSPAIDNVTGVEDEYHWWSSRTNAAHLFFNQSSFPPVWTSDTVPGISFTHLPIVDNRIQIKREGVYYVYAAFSLDFRSRGPVIPQIYHNITSQHPMLKNTGPQLHFMNKYGGFSNRQKTQYSSFLSGIVHLRRGFEVATQISTYSFLDHGKYSNFFGLFKLNS